MRDTTPRLANNFLLIFFIIPELNRIMDKKPIDASYFQKQELALIFLSYSPQQGAEYKESIKKLFRNSDCEFACAQAENLLFRLRRNLRFVDSQINVKANELNDPKLSPEGLVRIHRRANAAFGYMDRLINDLLRVEEIRMDLGIVYLGQLHEEQRMFAFGG